MLGYGYAHRSGRIGPVARWSPVDLPGFVGYLVRSDRRARGPAAGGAGPGLTVLGRCCRRACASTARPAIYCADGAGPRFDRYIPMSFALL